MLKKWIFYTSLITLTAFVSSGFSLISPDKNYEAFTSQPSSNVVQIAPLENQLDYIHFSFPYVGKSITGFRQALAFRESQGKLKVVNSYGCMGKYQFGKGTLKTIGIKNTANFLTNSKLQERAFTALLAKNKWELRHEIKKYDGKFIKGVRVTESGILASAHLGGVGATRKYLRTRGKSAFRDGYGTSMQAYLKQFGGYDTSGIKAEENAKVKAS